MHTLSSIVGHISKTIKHITSLRELLWAFTWHDIRVQFSGTVLGAVWSFLIPMSKFLIFLLVFGYFLKIRLPGSDSMSDYVLFFSAGFFPWTFFNASILRASSSMSDNRNYIKKIPFPAVIFPLSIVLSEMISLAIMLVILVIVVYTIGKFGAHLFFLVPVAIVHVIFTAAISIFVSAVSPRARDLPHALGPGLMAWFWVTPITYPADIVPEGMRFLIAWNPMHHIIVLYREVLFYQSPPHFWKFTLALFMAILLLSICLGVFQRAKATFSELL